MTVSKTSFHRFSIATQILGTLMLSDPGYGKPSPTTGGGGPASPGKIDDPSPGTTIKPF